MLGAEKSVEEVCWRQCYQFIAPLGVALSLVLLAKQLYQKQCKQLHLKISCGEEDPEDIVKVWKCWVSSLFDIVTVSRRI